MDRPKLLLAFGLGVALAVAFPASAQAGTRCNPTDANAGFCNISGSIDDGGVAVGGNKHTPGGSTGSGDGHGGSTDDDHPAGTGPGTHDCAQLLVCRDQLGATPDVTLEDVRHLLGSAGESGMEPDGWAVVGTNTNFFSTAAVLVKHTVVIKKHVAVRFTPIGWHWRYGDGTTADLSTAGAAWAALGIQEFDPTPTSHVFDRRGDFTVTLGVEFAAEYKTADSDWILIDGTFTLPSNPLHITATNATTVLVGRDCNQTPHGPGC